LTWHALFRIGARNSGRFHQRPFSVLTNKDMSDEAHFSAEQSRARTPARLPVADGDSGRTQHHPCASRSGPQVAVGLNPPALSILGRRADFLAANSGKRVAMPGFVLLVRNREDGDPAMRIGFTVTKKIGGAVVRNRMKRRFRALARELLRERGIPGADHVLIGRAGGVERDFAALRQELGKAFERVTR
jgi:ribonuclease P protein component